MSNAADAFSEWITSPEQEFKTNHDRASFMAGAAWALEDAADYALAVDKDGEAAAPDATGLWDNAHAALTDLLMNRHAAEELSEWLRDRAAGVGTKDGGPDAVE